METEKKEYTFEDLQKFNIEKRVSASEWIKGNYGRDCDTPELNLLNDPNPYNVLHDVIEQFYKVARSHYSQAVRVEGMQKELQILRTELGRLHTVQPKEERKEIRTLPQPLQELFTQCSAEEWAEIMGHVLDLLILSLSWDEIDEESVKGQLYYIRVLQKFFLAMQKK
ncbi:hypothetical protein M2480_001327 [Parabacteroides sp. PFB2-12]|uniref:hypothetical protein n=1 Tax=unclassified Parabacteroides TaxID=2649774 RepID=UPI0024765837|nr:MULTISPECIES: hypothetical protein [unclassified Parabacteroides]MDH6343338.1 hypothetical protein [Parabacteroides sp. PM6-13]MDH6390354.1 hypothetical protein [Parabacteroides sp. PFB2-12]